MKPIKASAVLLFLFFFFNLNAQNLIGYKERDIRKYMKENQKSMSFKGLTYNNTFKYLKYADRSDTQTLLFFLDADSVCKVVRQICDKTLKAERVSELDSRYKRSGENKWIETKNGKSYLIELKEEEWTFNVTIRVND